MGNTTLRNARKIFTGSGGDASLPDRVLTLENNEYKVTYYEIISGASGSLTLPTGATINSGEFGLSGNAILSKIDGSNKPTFESPLTSGGIVVTASLNETTGDWIASDTYTDANVALIYSIKIKAVYYSNLTYSRIIETTDLYASNGVLIDYSSTSTYTGWSSFTIQKIFGVDYPLYTIWTVEVSGVSDSAFATVTLPVSQGATYPNISRGSLVTNNGTNSAVGRVQLLAGTNIIQWSATAVGGGFTAAGTKSVRCQIIQYK